MTQIAVIHGPSLNLLGNTKPDIYGDRSLDEINEAIRKFAKQNKVDVNIFQFNHEGDIIETLHRNLNCDGIVLNPAGFTHYSYAIRSAVEAVPAPVVEVHISNIHRGEAFRKESVIAHACIGQISGLGWYGYLLAIQYLSNKAELS